MSRSLFAPPPRWRSLALTAAVLTVALTSAPRVLAQASPVASPPAARSQILMLGTGTPIIDAAHSGTSVGILVRGSLYIFDAGPGVERLMQRYHASAHTSTYELAEIAAKAKPKLLVLYHQLYLGGTTDDDLVREVRSRYNGRVVSAHDLDVY
jgi:ribonuclease BN (tRNA processing enzyme)